MVLLENVVRCDEVFAVFGCLAKMERIANPPYVNHVLVRLRWFFILYWLSGNSSMTAGTIFDKVVLYTHFIARETLVGECPFGSLEQQLRKPA